MSGIKKIEQERNRQINEEGFDSIHDNQYKHNELESAAFEYLRHTIYGTGKGHTWPWPDSWWKPSDNKIRNLEKAGALIAASIDRIERQKQDNK